jgi:hypothetical protein
MDLLKDYTVCFIDDDYHLQGTEHMELRCAADVVQLAGAGSDEGILSFCLTVLVYMENPYKRNKVVTNDSAPSSVQAVETRLTRGTKMNDTSSRSHCVAMLKLTVLEGGAVRVISDCHFLVQLNRFIPGFLSYSVAVF